METSDIRIGNLIDYMDKNCICGVREILSTQINVTAVTHCPVFPSNPIHIANIGGIKLTGEWLLLFGFRRSLETWEGDYHLPGMYINEQSDGFYLRHNTNTYINRVPLVFVHEVQNLYHSLTRRDIEINRDRIEMAIVEGKLNI